MKWCALKYTGLTERVFDVCMCELKQVAPKHSNCLNFCSLPASVIFNWTEQYNFGHQLQWFTRNWVHDMHSFQFCWKFDNEQCSHASRGRREYLALCNKNREWMALWFSAARILCTIYALFYCILFCSACNKSNRYECLCDSALCIRMSR